MILKLTLVKVNFVWLLCHICFMKKFCDWKSPSIINNLGNGNPGLLLLWYNKKYSVSSYRISGWPIWGLPKNEKFMSRAIWLSHAILWSILNIYISHYIAVGPYINLSYAGPIYIYMYIYKYIYIHTYIYMDGTGNWSSLCLQMT